MDPTLDTDLNVDNLIYFLCAFSALTRSSVNAADRGTLSIDRPFWAQTSYGLFDP